MNNEKKSVTLKDIAAKTGFSVTAVSHALKDMSDISSKAKEQIKECAEELGYIGNFSASTLRTGKSNTIAMIVGDLANPHFAFLAKKVQSEMARSGYTVFFMSTNESFSVEREAILMACSRNIDGIILCPSQSSYSLENVEFIRRSGIPFVLIGRYFKELKTNYVIANDNQAGYLLGKHIVERGHKNIAYINTQQTNSSSDERLNGFYKALSESSLQTRMCEIPFDDLGSYFDDLIKPDRSLGFSVAVAFNDVIAWDLMCRLQLNGISSNPPLSIAGFDNLHAYLPLPFRLTSVSSPKNAMPKEACKLLLKQIENHKAPVQGVVLDVTLHDRKSVIEV